MKASAGYRQLQQTRVKEDQVVFFQVIFTDSRETEEKHTTWAAGKGRGEEKQEKEDKEEEEEEEREEGALLLKNLRLSPILPQRILIKS